MEELDQLRIFFDKYLIRVFLYVFFQILLFNLRDKTLG
jgi:hypothetical protein